MRPVLVLLLLGVVAALAAALAWRGGEAALAPAEDRSAAPADPAAADRQRGSVRDEPAAREAVAPAPQREDAKAAYHIRVVDGATGAPVAGAVVHWLPVDFDGAGVTPDERASPDAEAYLARHGRSVTADADGRVAIAATPRGISVVGRAGPRYGQSGYSLARGNRHDADDPFVLALQRDRALTLRTVDVHGRAVPGMHVRLDVVPAAHDPEDGRIRLGPSDRGGFVRLPHAQQLAALRRTGITAAVEMRVGHGEAKLLDPRALPETPVDVIVPPHGSLEVVLLGPDGAPWESPVEPDERVFVRAADAPGYPTRDDAVPLGRDGRAVVERIACGLPLHVSLTAGDRFAQTVAGPAQHGERVRAELRMSARAPILVGRAVDVDGAPMRGTLSLVFTAERWRGGSELHTDDDGRFREPLPAVLDGETVALSLKLRENGRDTDVVAVIAPGIAVTGGVNDIGDVVFAQAPLLVAGRVVYEDGTPADPSQIQVESAPLATPQRWANVLDVRARKLGDGRFVVRARDDGHRFRVRLYGPFVPIDPVPFAPGDDDLVIRVERSGDLEVTFVVDAATPWRDLIYRLTPRDAATRQRLAYLLEVVPALDAEHVVCRWRGLVPGPYELTVHCPGIDEPLVAIGSIAVRATPSQDDPRLRGIDLRGRVRTLRLTLTDASGAPIRAPNAVVVVRGRDEDGARWRGYPVDAGSGRAAVLASRPVDVLACAPGFDLCARREVFADMAIALERLPRVHLRLAEGLPRLPPDAELVLTVAGHETRGAPRPTVWIEEGRQQHGTMSVAALHGRAPSSHVLGNGDVALDVRGGGVRALALTLRRRLGNDVRAAPVELAPASLDFDAIDGDRTIELHGGAGTPRCASARDGASGTLERRGGGGVLGGEVAVSRTARPCPSRSSR